MGTDKKNNGSDYLIKFLLNEKEVAVQGLATNNFPYYKWNDVRSFYLKNLTAPGAGINRLH